MPYTLDSTYWDPGSEASGAHSSAYQPPAEGDLLGPEPSAGDDAYAAGAQATAGGHGALPAVSNGPGGAAKPSHVVLQFEGAAPSRLQTGSDPEWRFRPIRRDNICWTLRKGQQVFPSWNDSQHVLVGYAWHS